jgi:hypothetical protein
MVGAAGIQVDAGDTSTVYTDMSNHWAQPFVNAAKTHLTGYNDAGGQTYRPDMPALREDVAVVLVTAEPSKRQHTFRQRKLVESRLGFPIRSRI